jgi:predicted AAA+ superfamily ATPase
MHEYVQTMYRKVHSSGNSEAIVIIGIRPGGKATFVQTLYPLEREFNISLARTISI